jgi:hypothetical protein
MHIEIEIEVQSWMLLGVDDSFKPLVVLSSDKIPKVLVTVDK